MGDSYNSKDDDDWEKPCGSRDTADMVLNLFYFKIIFLIIGVDKLLKQDEDDSRQHLRAVAM